MRRDRSDQTPFHENHSEFGYTCIEFHHSYMIKRERGINFKGYTYGSKYVRLSSLLHGRHLGQPTVGGRT